ncbi:ribonuclease E [Fulvimarina manganoxydans]|uniref:Ribonuclease E n=2 Tax=Fulvimarina manganoxydans TaxID=937218 RepID=A0A1W1ZZP8_9HYPH|nr:ribonuclease E/G [Fulvimarina manganoxydans]SMC53641.1 ribonuclease E [Fulvimarina manganoxydans]
MANKMLIDASHPEETRVVVVRGNRVEEFDFESEHKKQLKGNIYLAKVTRVEPSLQAAFVEYGGNRHGFLAFSEIHPDYYQIPKADREALLAEELARGHEDDDEDDVVERPEKRRRRPAKAAARKRSDEDSVSESVDTDGVEIDSDGSDETSVASSYDGDADAITAGDDAPNAQQDGASDEAGIQADDDASGEVKARKHDRDNDQDDDSDSAEDEDDSSDEDDDEDAEDEEADDSDSDDSSSEDEEGGPSSERSNGARRGRGRRRGRRKPNAEARNGNDQDGDDDNGSDDDSDDIDEIGSEDAMEEVPVRQARPRKQYKIQEVIKRRQILLVQVVKEERGNKGAALTTYLSLAGRYSVLMPNTARGGGISRKITNQADRKRLKDVVRELDVPRGMGIILRTAGANRTKAEVKRDYEYLMRLWESVRTLTLQSTAPALVYEEGSLIKRSIRDLYNKDIDQVLVSGEAGYREAKDFMRMLMPSQAKAVQPYNEPVPIFARQGIEGQLDKMLQPHVTLKSGGYIIINQTEALVAIDVNSGRSTREMSIESTALQTNLEAAEEVARQLRLRDLAGLIVVDFIDMDEKRNNRAVEKKLKDCLKNDRARIQVGKISHFGLLEMSRQRIRASVLESTMRACPVCEGAGLIRSASSLALHAVRHIEEYIQKNASNDIIVKVPIETALYILNEKRHHIDDLEQTHGLRILIEADASIGHQGLTIEAGGPSTQPITKEFVSPISMSAEDAIDEELAREAAALEAEDESVEASEPEARNLIAESDEDDDSGNKRRKRRRRRRRGGKGDEAETNGDAESASDDDDSDDDSDDETSDSDNDENGQNGSGRRRRRRGRRGGRRHRDGTNNRDDQANDNDERHDGDAVAASSAKAPSDDAKPGEQKSGETSDQGPEAEEPVSAADTETPAEKGVVEPDLSEPVVTSTLDEAPEAETAPTPAANADERLDEPVAKLVEPTNQDESAAPVAAYNDTSDEVEVLETKSAVIESDRAEAAAVSVSAEGEKEPQQVEAAASEEQPSADTETPPVAENVAEADADMTSETVDEPAATAAPLTQPVVTSGSESEGEDERPRRTGWWSRRGFL